MKTSLITGALIAVAACSSRGIDTEPARIGSLAFEVPVDWQRLDSDARGVQTSVWTPSDNERNESITIIRSERNAVVATSSAATFERLLVDAQRGLPNARVSAAMPIKTARGLSGMRVRVDFTPAGQRDAYRRSHAVLADEGVLVNVMYTARDPDSSERALEAVLASIRHEEG